ncbi:MAG: hypothetical protein IPP40_16070 [bacterium]|nr:hypothetical protein [bacterium]
MDAVYETNSTSELGNNAHPNHKADLAKDITDRAAASLGIIYYDSSSRSVAQSAIKSNQKKHLIRV